jgi:murein DD-endopeptidase MepM/ murein hydrolase activator NlpD
LARMQKKYYTIMFIPEGNAKTFSMHIHRNIVYSLVAFLLVFFVGFILLVIKSGEIAAKVQLVYMVTSENRQLKEENRKLVYSVEKIEKIERMGRYLQKIARASGLQAKQGQPVLGATHRSGEQVFLRDNMDEALDSMRIISDNDSRVGKKKNETSEMYLASLPNIQPVVDGWITRRYIVVANDTDQAHNGIDYAATQGTLIRSTAPGVVEEVSNDRYFGLILTIKHGYGISSRYGHCSQILVVKGDHVERGQTIALVGNTGRSSAPHLHYEVLKEGKNIDPTQFIFGNEDK